MKTEQDVYDEWFPLIEKMGDIEDIKVKQKVAVNLERQRNFMKLKELENSSGFFINDRGQLDFEAVAEREKEE